MTTTPVITTTPTTLVEPPTTTVVEEKCKWGILVNYTASFANLTAEEVYDLKIKSIINAYCSNGSSVIVDAQASKFQITTTPNEIKNGIDSKMTSINLTECENILKEHYHIDPELNLIILKYFKEDQTFQYELYSPITHEKLNLSLCENIKTEVFVSLEMDEKTEEIYNNLKEQGYDPLDLNDKFYREICTPYTSENGTDVLLDDREEFIYSSLVNDSLCPSGCNYSEYVLGMRYEYDRNRNLGFGTFNW